MAKIRMAAIILLVSAIWYGCKDRAAVEDPVSLYGEDAIYRSGDSTLYLCRHEWRGIKIGETDPSGIVEYMPWRVPTREEAIILRKYTIDEPSTERYIAKDTTGVYYTFLFGSGNVTKAGMKTKYTLRPVRLEVTPKDTIVEL